MNPTLEIFSQGEEIVTGQTVDTNAAWLSQACVNMGFTVSRHTAVGDRLDELIALLKEISSRADCCICTGGLGPTSDDLTAQAVSLAFSMPLQFDTIAFEQIAGFFKNRSRTMPESNRKQAYLPSGALRIDNQWGTAPGFTLQYNRCRFVFLPGVPFEMQHLFNEFVKCFFERHYALNPKQLVTLKTIGIGESDIQTAIADITIPQEIQLGFRAGPDHIETKLLAPAQYPRQKLDLYIDTIKSRLGDFIFGIADDRNHCDDLPSTIDRMMRDQQRTAIFIETISQGLMAAKCSLANEWLLETHYQRNPAHFADRFSVAIDDMDLPSQAKIIANAAKDQSGADLALIQLYRENNATDNPDDRTITIYNALLSPEGLRHSTHTIGGSVKRKQNQAALLALDLLRRYLQNTN
jgi:competence/damage-inducible protein CinA-like protein